MTIMTVTTVGYREIHPLSRAGRVFNIGVLIFGVATVLYTFSFLMARLVEGDLHERWVRRRRERMLDELDNHFIVCGYGRMGHIIAQEFVRQAVPFVIIERDPERMQEAIEAGFLAVEADASSEQVLKRVGIDARPRLHRRGQHRRRECLRGPDRAAAAAGSVHHRPRRDRRCERRS